MIAKFLSEYLFWVLQFVGWGSLALLLTVTGGGDNDPDNSWVMFILMGVLGIFFSTFLRWILKTKVAKFQWGRKKVVYIILANLFCIVFSIVLAISAAIMSGIADAQDGVENDNNFGDIYFVFTTAIVIAAFALLVWTIFYYGIKYLIKYNKARVDRLQLKEAIKSAQLKTLKGHIHPQFLVTSLKNIKKLMLVNVKESRDMITALSELLRYSLTKNDETSVTILNEMEMVQKYRQVLAIDKSTSFSIDASIPNEVYAETIPPMLLLNLVILGSKYGIGQSSLERGVHVLIEKNDLMIKTSVSFKGELEEVKEAKEMENSLKQRLMLLYGTASSYNVNFLENKTTLEIELPCLVNLELNIDYGIN